MAEPPDDSLEPIDRLRAIVRILRGPGGCPWDIEQTQKSLIPNILEEAYEAADAIRSGNKNNVIEELGDLLLQVVMQSEIASESDDFFLEDVAIAISDKLIRRHPHVFGDDQLNDTESVLNKWEEIKRSEKGNQKKYILDGVTNGLPSLIKAHEIQKKVEKVGFDWPEARSVIPKIREELDEVEEAPAANDANASDLAWTVKQVRQGNLQGLNWRKVTKTLRIADLGAIDGAAEFPLYHIAEGGSM